MIQLKIDATESTNDYLKQLLRQGPIDDGVFVRTLDQTKGRGQRGADWFFEKNKSLAMSVLKIWNGPLKPNPIHLQWVITNSVFEVLRDLGGAAWHIKWPNDIMADGKKIAGLLIEHQFKGSLQSSVIGVGVNVNNSNVHGLPHASSIAKVLGRSFDLEDLCERLANKIYSACQAIQHKDFDHDLAKFNACLYRKNTTSSFIDNDQQKLEGVIRGVSPQGYLEIQTQHGLKAYEVGTIKMNLDLP